MWQGICGAPATFQQTMKCTVGDMNMLEVLVYLDDMITFGNTLVEHEAWRPPKCLIVWKKRDYGCHWTSFSSVTSLIHTVCQTIVSQDGVCTDAAKMAVATFPRTVTLLRLLLSFCGYYLWFIKGYAQVSHPLNQLLHGYPPHHKSQSKKLSNKAYLKTSDPFVHRWTDQFENTFNQFMTCLLQVLVTHQSPM